MMERRFNTTRLVLRSLALSDAAAMHPWFMDPEVMRFWSTLPHRDFAQTEAWVRASVEAQAEGKAHDFAVFSGGRMIGRIAFWDGPELGFLFDPAFQGQGFASEALKAMIAFGFDELGFDELTADVDPDNAASLRLLERNGFTRVGFAKDTFEIGGKFFDSVYLALKRPA